LQSRVRLTIAKNHRHKLLIVTCKLFYMKTARLMKYLFIVIALTLVSPTFAAVTEVVGVVTPTETPEAKIARLTQRIEEIKAMDKSELSREQRKALKKEVREIRDEVKAASGGVYLSVGAILLIVLLLILIL
jgi:hypothetical protein